MVERRTNDGKEKRKVKRETWKNKEGKERDREKEGRKSRRG